MKSTRISALVLAFATVLVGACATVPPAEESNEDGPCLRVRKIRSSEALGDFHVVVTVKGGDHYLLTADEECLDMKDADSVKILAPKPQICGNGLSSLMFLVPTQGTRHCKIIKVDRVEDEEEALALAEQHAMKMEEKEK